MNKTGITRATLGRLPLYLQYIRSNVTTDMISASTIARDLGLGEVLVRKDFHSISQDGRPKVGYRTKSLIGNLESILCTEQLEPVVIVGAGKLGMALQGYEGFSEYGMEILAAFDNGVDAESRDLVVYPMEQMPAFCREHQVHIGIIAVPAHAAQEVCDQMLQSGITAIWNFAPCNLQVPSNITVRQENLALSLAHLHMKAQTQQRTGGCIHEKEKL